MKRYALIAIGCLVLLFAVTPGAAHAAIIFDASSSKTFSGVSLATTSITVGTGSNEMLIIEYANGNAIPTGQTVTVNGNAATNVMIATGTSRYGAIWYYPNLSSGTYNVSSTWTNTGQGALAVTSFFGVSQSTPIDATSTKSGTNLTPSSSVTTNVAGDLIVDATPHQTTASTTAVGGAQIAIVKDAGGISYTGNASYFVTSTIGLVKSSYTLNGSVNWLMAQAAFKAAPPPDATSVSTTTGNDGARSGDSITITGTNFGTVATSSAAICNGGAGTGCIQFIVGGTDTVPSSSITSWTNTSITFTVPATLNSNGGTSTLQVWATNASDTTPLTFYIYPKISAVASVGTNAARVYNAADTDGLIMLSGDHLGTTTSTATILGSSATLHYSTGGSCSVAGYASTTNCYEVPAAIATNTYNGTITFTRGSDGKQASTSSLSILPRILAVNPASTSTGNVVQIVGDHFCPTGTCPVSPNRATSTTNVAFGGTMASDSDFVDQTGGAGTCNGAGAAWGHGEICVKVPAGASAGSASTTVTSNGNASNLFSFTVTSSSAPGIPGTPTYSGVGTGTLTVNWASSTNTNYYKIERATSSQSYAQISTTSALSYADSGLIANATFYYRVRGNGSGGDGPYSASSSVLMLPDVPGTPSFASVSTSTLTVNWIAPGGGAASYKIERATSSLVFAQIASTSSLSYPDSGLAQSTVYYYQVRATNATGDGAYSGNASTTTSASGNSPPNAPTLISPATGIQDVATAPVFTVSSTDPEGNALQYKIIIYSTVGCSGVVQTDDQSSGAQTGWSGQNTSSSKEYTSGTPGVFTVQSALSTNTTYYWRASAKDPEGSNSWTDSAACNSFTTTFGNWTTDSGTWSISSGALVVSSTAGSSVQVHIAGLSLQDGVLEFKATASVSGFGSLAGIARADSGANRYKVTVGDIQNGRVSIGKTISGIDTTLTSTTRGFAGNTFVGFRGLFFGTTPTTLTSHVIVSMFGTSTISATDTSLSAPGFVGLAVFSTNSSTVYSFDDFAVSSGTTITMNNLPAGYSWQVFDSGEQPISGCLTGNSADLSAYIGQMPIDYDNGGGEIAAWTNNNCSGSDGISFASAFYPSQNGFANDIFGGDVYAFSSTASGTTTGGGVPVDTATVTVNSVGQVSY